MNFIIYDLSFMVLFLVFIGFFLYKKGENLKKEGSLILYKTKWGIKLINHVGSKYKKTIKFLSYISIGLGYILMTSMLYLVGKVIYIYIAYPEVVRSIKVPPIMPLVPYFTELPGIKGMFPTFYFVVFILAIIVVATIHEFSHGIFMKRYNIKIKSTGFAFFKYFPAFLGAFVEQDEKDMKSKSNFSQMAVLSAGTFANVLTAIFFFIIMGLFFSLSFAPSGLIFDDYAYDVVGIESITMVNGVALTNTTFEKISNLINEEGLNKIQTEDNNYVSTKEFLDIQGEIYNYTFLYYDSPAINSGLKGAITNINGVQITSLEVFQDELSKYSAGDNITIETFVEENTNSYEIELGENPNEEGSGYLGVGFRDTARSGAMGKIVDFISSFKKSNIYYEDKFEAAWFFYNLFWWIALINLLVALFNMLPVGGLDGGRFFYLTILGLTKSKVKAEKTFKFVTQFFLFLLFLLMVLWVISFF
ncbi:site-2 protease family protein [Candidatus Pacearchaeota archaeon]|nr:site-2 protease family protein [Candidatus Pacearchaeota archaeon]